METPLVSINVFTYNQQDFVVETLTSALEQDWDRLEVVVADDGSTDGTADLIRELARKYPGRLVPVLSPNNVGITRNCNRSIDLCRGTLIATQGGDDVLLPGKIRRQAEMMIADPSCDMSYHDAEVFESSTGATMHLFSEFNPFREGGIEQIILYGTFRCATTVMVRRLPGQALRFDERIPVASDWLYYVDALAARRGTLRRLDGVWARYRRHTRNVTLDSRHALRERLLTLDIVEKEHPEYKKLARFARSRILTYAAWDSCMKERRPLKAAAHLAAALHAAPDRLPANLGEMALLGAKRAAARIRGRAGKAHR